MHFILELTSPLIVTTLAIIIVRLPIEFRKLYFVVSTFSGYFLCVAIVFSADAIGSWRINHDQDLVIDWGPSLLAIMLVLIFKYFGEIKKNIA